MVRPNKILQKLQNDFAGRWRADMIRTFVQCIHSNINRVLSWQFEHAFKTLLESGFARLFRTVFTLSMELRKNSPAFFGVIGELYEDGSQQAPDVTFVSIPEVKVVVHDQSSTGCPQFLDILDDSRTS